MTTLDAPFLELTAHVTPRPMPPEVPEARRQIRAAMADLARIPDAALTSPWKWSAQGQSDIRYAFFRCYEILELAAADAEATVTPGPARPAAVRLMGPASASRWDLHGLLHGISDVEWNADPGSGEWTIGRTLAHIIGSQRSFAWGSGWWLRQAMLPDDPALPPRVPADFLAAMPDEATEGGAETRAQATVQLDAILDLSTERLAGLSDEMLELGARYGGAPVSLGFRLGRWSSHIREHTIQVEKTLAMLDRRPPEVDRLIRLVMAAYGRLEAVVFGLPPAPGAATAIVVRAASAVREIAVSAAGSMA